MCSQSVFAAFFEAVRQRVLEIHAFYDGKEVKLKPDPIDDISHVRLSNNYLGDGTSNSPYAYDGASPHSPFYMIVDFWDKFRGQVIAERKVFMKVNDYVFELTGDGVIAEDGVLTKLVQ